MNLGTHYLFTRPVGTLTFPVRVRGQIPDLTGLVDEDAVTTPVKYSRVEFESDGLPPLSPVTVDIATATYGVEVLGEFERVGRFEVRARLLHDGGSDISDPLHLDVQGTVATWVDGPQATYRTGQPTSTEDVVRAGRVIGAVVGADLSNPVVRARYSAADRELLACAVSWQAAAYARQSDPKPASAAGATGLPFDLPAGVQSVSVDGMSVTLRADAAGPLTGLALDPMANRYLLGLSTRDTAIYARPVTGSRVAPNLWERL